MTRAMGAIFQNKKVAGAEIGVASGGHAKTLLSFLNIKKLYLIDSWEGYLYPKMLYTKKELSKFSDRTVFLRKKSFEAADDIPNEVDFVYIDGNHDYEFVKEDIRLYYDKVKSGGVFGGHDFSPDYPGVIKAVNELVKEKGLKLYGKQATDLKESDWWVIKP